MNEKAKKIVEVINEVVVMDDVQPGYPDANGNTVNPATGVIVTWCNRALHRMLDRLGGRERLILEPRGVNWTSANIMVRYARSNTERVRTAIEAQRRAFEGELIIAVADNTRGSGHVALVCPAEENEWSEFNPLIGQAGMRNGIMRLSEGFAHLTPSVEYYHIPYEEGIAG